MTSLYVDEPGVGLRLKQGRVEVEKNGVLLQAVPVDSVERLALVRNASLSTHLLGNLLDAGVPVLFLRPHGGLRGRACVPLGKNSLRRVRQVECLQDAPWRLRFSQTLVWSKLSGNCDLLHRQLRRVGDDELLSSRAQLQELAERALEADSLETLRGIEGQAARLSFAAYARLFKDKNLSPGRRSKRPPRDPVNSLLSFGYTLLVGELAARLEIAGLDPGIGFYHNIKYGRDSLACDLVEEFRHLVDRMVLGFFNRGQFDKDDFVWEADGACLLNDTARKTFYRSYEQALEGDLLKGRSCRALFERQVRELIAAVDDRREYQPACLDGG